MRIHVTCGLILVGAALTPVPLMTPARAGGEGLPVHNITTGTDYPTIQAAIGAAGWGGHTIEVDPGTYFERINLLCKRLTLRSTDGPDATIIDGSLGGTVVTTGCSKGIDYSNRAEGVGAEIRGFTITNGLAVEGGGMHTHHNLAARVNVVNCIFSGNSASRGGGMYNGPNAQVVLQDCVFVNNSAELRGGGMYNYLAGVGLYDCVVNGNSAGGNGGGMYSWGSPTIQGAPIRFPQAYRTIFVGNTAGDRGGGMADHSFNAKGGIPFINFYEDCTFDGNTANSGGGMYFVNFVNLKRCTIIGNTAQGSGGGLESTQEVGQIRDCVITGNSATGSGGGMNLQATMIVTNSTFSGNSAGSSSNGGGLVGGNAAHCVFAGNSAGFGGGKSGGDAANCVFTGNSATWFGGGMIAGDGATVTNCTFSRNSVALEQEIARGGGILLQGNGTATNCIAWGNTAFVDPQISGENATVTYSCVEGGFVGEGNIDADPLFSAGPDGCFYLSQTTAGLPYDSPCLDAGSDTSANLELDELSTRRDEVGDAGMVNMGYHYPVTKLPFIHGDFDRDGDVDLDDFSEWTAYSTGPCAAAPCWPAAYTAPCGNIADFDDDGDVDLEDFRLFQQHYTGS